MGEQLPLFAGSKPTRDNLQERLDQFKKDIHHICGNNFVNYPKEFQLDFFDYWSEYNTNGVKMKWEKVRDQKNGTWDLKRRIERFYRGWKPKNGKGKNNTREQQQPREGYDASNFATPGMANYLSGK